MSFDTDAVRDGIGRLVRVDFSTDRFATTALRVGTKAGLLDGTNMYSSRVVSVGSVRRGLGQRRIATGSTTELVLDNADGALDAWHGRANMASLAALRVRIYVCLFDPASPSSFTSKLLGEFALTEWPRVTAATITMQLGDDMLGSVGQLAALPTLLDWQAVGTTSNNPIKTSMGLPDSLSDAAPIQLAFGEDWVHCLPHVIPWEGDAAYEDTVIVPVCVTTDLTAAADSLISNVRVQWQAYDETGDAGTTQGEVGIRWKDVPRTIIDNPDFGSSSAVERTVWRVEKSPTITKDGKSFQVVYLVVICSLGIKIYETAAHANNWENSSLGQYQTTGGYPLAAIDWVGDNYKVTASRVLNWFVKGSPLSARTQTTSPIQHPCDVIADLVGYYSKGSAVALDATQLARVRAANISAAVAGVVQPWSNGPKKGEGGRSLEQSDSLRQILTQLAQSGDFDIFINWDAEVSFTGDIRDYTTATAAASMLSFVETEANSIKTWIPSGSERFSPYNRLYFVGGKDNPAEQATLGFQGPFDFSTGTTGIDLADRVVEATLEHGWRPWRQQSFAPWSWRALDVSARERLSFVVSLRGLLLELGDYFTWTWTRGDVADTAGILFDADVFQVESITYAPGGDEVEIEAIWRDDLNSTRQYLLDDETLLVRTKPASASLELYTSLGSTYATTTAGAVNFATMGVEAGDILVLRDSSQADDVFTLNRCIRILGFDDDWTIYVDPTDTSGIPASPSAATLLNADWSIVRGATTYPTAVSDPTNYPDGGDMYGKVTSSAGEYSDAATGNALLNG